ncbi:SusC/RagA family TonB-linked outer membrane protein [Subsaximicrobium wynnwilliamsii]|uniref:SusC/RagA family TonB-linked outer membrane protein n=1 Tax=Subsaximicrobium wynnwilliamsii TaxID=291179 RepID=A0A5C6ZC91_9FLAO|nr:SusC/RagA family TonB-linked outer membrane protein [Subsaximicrobium wynnwilliamsii]TXD83139.1 SusC/RagA family TonB-linked outer membrane protein [Subsaximicrobium wynnwilliamsii]TXD86711.1 SusC/RagA family TonB-linked outer membrane protein [Subsaximicrobium wynnwilliamsii]TXE02973.1 SusC/RagA family TonB-linked outer membrane protein [Subsaximicrobium wynnwilliamsii]
MKQNLLQKVAYGFFFLLAGIMHSQTVSGIVSDNSGPLPGVNVLVKGTANGTQTNFDGEYILNNVPSDGVLVYSFVGFKTQEVNVGGRDKIDITLAEDAALLDEIVLIGYGTTTIKDATGSISTVTAEEFNGGVISSPEQLIQGKTAGVQITQSSGEPGAGVAIRIRGTSSLSADNNPLFVVDGIPLSTGGTAGGADLGGGTSSARNPLSFLNPNDIATMTVLKDASATAIYGSRGSNGVVIITTKSGQKGGGGVFELNSNTSFSRALKRFDLLEGPQYLNAITQFGGNAEALNFGSNTDWQDVILRDVFSTDNTFAYSNNYGDGYVRGSIGLFDQQGVVENSSQERLTGRVNASHRFFDDKLKVDINATLSKIDDESPYITNSAGSQGDLLGATYFANPTWPNTVEFTSGDGKLNPRQLLTYYQDLNETNRTLLNGAAEYSILSNLKAKVNLGYDKSESTRTQVISPDIDGFNNGATGNGRAALQDVNVENQLMDLTLNYTKEFKNSSLEVLLGYSYQSFQNSGRTVLGYGMNSNNLGQIATNLENAANIIEGSIGGTPFQQYGFSSAGLFINQILPTINGNVEIGAPSGVPVNTVTGNTFDFTDELQSYFTRVNYKLGDKYLFTFTLRADGSSRFGPDNQYGYFPSGAFAWQLHKEDFIPEAFSNLKLRLSYGKTGNQDALGYGNFIQRQRFGDPGIGNGGEVQFGSAGIISNEDSSLQWEETLQSNIGFDYGFFNDRLSGSIDLYHKSTTNLILQQLTAQPAINPFRFSNVDADIINKGIEFAINYDIIQQEDMNWNFGFNVAYNENEVQNFDGLIQTGEINGNGLTGAFAQLLAEGQPLYSFFLRDFAGFDENGISIYPNGDQQEFVGKSALPDIIVGINTSFSYKNWDVNAFLNGQYGQYIYNNTANAFFTAGIIGSGQNVTQNVLSSGESTANAPDVSTRFLEKGDFLRLQTASIGYRLNLEDNSFFKSVRLSITGQNLFVITPYSGLDPEVDTPSGLNNIPSFGIDYTSFPRPRTFTFGLNANF